MKKVTTLQLAPVMQVGPYDRADMDTEQAQLKQVQMMQAAGEAGQSVGAAGQHIAGAVQQATGANGGQ